MESAELDVAVENLEKLLSDINQINFKIEGFKEEITSWEKNFPKVFRRQIDLNNRRIYKLSVNASGRLIEKEQLESEIGQYRLEHAPKKKTSPKTSGKKKEE